MSWDRPRPQLDDNDIAQTQGAQEVYDRLAPFGTVSLGSIDVAANDTTDTVINLRTGSKVRAGMGVGMNPPVSLPQGVVIGSVLATATDSLTLRLGNVSAVPRTVPSGTWTYWGVIV